MRDGTILVTGGTGFVGQHVAAALLARGHRVRLMGRDFSGAGTLLEAGAEPVQADLRHREAVVAACAGAGAVVHAGALSAPWGSRAEFFATNVGGTEAVLEGCRRQGVGRLVHLSSPSVVFSGVNHVLQTEATPYPRRFTSTYALTKKLGEDAVRTADDLEAVILRPKAVYGPGDRALLPRLIAAARRGRLPCVGDGANLVDLTHVLDVVRAVLLALESPRAAGKTYTITGGEHVVLWGAVRAVLRQLGLSDRLPRVPLPAALAAAAAMEGVARLTGGEPILTRYSVLILARTQTYDITAARRDLGYAPGVSLEEGLASTVAALIEGRP